jgi:hypothetical protein
MQLSILLFESLMALLFIICLSHALKRGKQFVNELVTAMVYGVLLEILTMVQLKYYTYGDFLIKIFNAPLAIGIGWAVIIYTAMATTDKLGVAQKVRPFLVTLLALDIDLSMDAIAIREGFWTWGVNGLWFGVPLGNFFAWFVVVMSFSYFIYHFRTNRKFPGYYPAVSMIISIIILLVLDWIWVYYLPQNAQIFVLLAMLFLSIGYAFLNYKHMKKDNEPDWKVFSVPFVFHVFFLTLLLFNEYRLLALVLISSSMMVLGVYIHLLPSLNKIIK